MKYISREDLAEIIKNDLNKPGTDYLVVDVRDDDFVGGNIKGAKNVPSENFTKGLSELVKETRDIPKVVFHCTYSQIRGPKAARGYEEALGDTQKEIVVLRDGFAHFQAKYKNDSKLVENWDKAVWEEAWQI